MKELEHHRIANIFPLLEGEELQGLADDIEAKGLRDPIMLYGGKILDGRNRYAACKLAGVVPRFVKYASVDPLGFVISMNLKRRHLSTSQRQMIAAEIETLKHGGDRKSSDQDANLHLDVSRGTAATMMNVSPRGVASAREVIDKGTPELIADVKQGLVSVSAAVKTLKPASPDIEEEEREIRKAHISVIRGFKKPLPMSAVSLAASLSATAEDDCFFKSLPDEEKWQQGLETMCRHVSSVRAYWDSRFGDDWKKYEVHPWHLMHAKQAGVEWNEMVAGLGEERDCGEILPLIYRINRLREWMGQDHCNGATARYPRIATAIKALETLITETLAEVKEKERAEEASL